MAVIIDELLGLAKLLRLPPLAIGLAMYLPMSATFMVIVGAVLGWIYEKTAGSGATASSPSASAFFWRRG